MTSANTTRLLLTTALISLLSSTDGFQFHRPNFQTARRNNGNTKIKAVEPSSYSTIMQQKIPYSTRCTRLHMSEDTETESHTNIDIAPPPSIESLINEVTESEWMMMDDILADDKDDQEDELEKRVADALPRMLPRFVMTLKRIAAEPTENLVLSENDSDINIKASRLRQVGDMLEFILDRRLQKGRDLLAELLRSGEIRKLDAQIGNAQRAGKLDMAFFTVLNMNIKDAFAEAEAEGSDVRAGNGSVPMNEMAAPDDDEEGAGSNNNRLQILQHIYTRCQEEVEKAVKPGVGLLNKLLRTEMPAIRKNQLQHYLSPQTSLTLPDGKIIPLQSTGKPLVPPNELVSAMSDAVKQIREVESAGGTDRVTAANLVETCRQLAMEARMAVMEVYGEGSDELKEFQLGLQPVFRPVVKN